MLDDCSSIARSSQEASDEKALSFFEKHSTLLNLVTPAPSIENSASQPKQPSVQKRTNSPAIGKNRPTIIPRQLTSLAIGRTRPILVPPQPRQITTNTTLQDVIALLTKESGIRDLTDQLSSSLTVSPQAIHTTALTDVYRAAQVDGAHLALKCLRQVDEKYAKRTARELNTWSKLSHENILELKGFAVFQNRLAMVSPWMEYGNVASAVAQWPELDRYGICQQLTEAVKYLHNQDVVHGDIKGANLLLGSDGLVKLTDFGLTILHDQALNFTQTTLGGGTLRWMAPELFGENAQRCSETDMYAMGMTIWEILKGDVPFSNLKSDWAIRDAVVQEKRSPSITEWIKEPYSPRALTISAIMLRCWAYDPKKRATAPEVAGMMEWMGLT